VSGIQLDGVSAHPGGAPGLGPTTSLQRLYDVVVTGPLYSVENLSEELRQVEVGDTGPVRCDIEKTAFLQQLFCG
jgi:hypothetical protein